MSVEQELRNMGFRDITKASWVNGDKKRELVGKSSRVERFGFNNQIAVAVMPDGRRLALNLRPMGEEAEQIVGSLQRLAGKWREGTYLYPGAIVFPDESRL